MKNTMKRLLICLLVLVMTSSSWLSGPERANAASGTVAGLANMGTVYSDFLGNGTDHSALVYWCMYGTDKISYCLQYGYLLSSGQGFTSTGSSLPSMTADQVKQLQYCLYYGYQAGMYGICSHGNGETCPEEWIPYAATQAMVWLIVAGKYHDTDAVNQWGSIVADSTGYPARVLAEYRALYARMEAALNMEPPSFSKEDRSAADTYIMEWNETEAAYMLTLTDDNGVLSAYDWTLPSGVTATRSGNRVTFTAERKVDRSLVEFNAKSGASANRENSSLVFWQPTDTDKQNQVQYGSVDYDPIQSFLYLKTGERPIWGYVELTKTDSVTGEGLEGVRFELEQWSASANTYVSVEKVPYNAVTRRYETGALYYTQDNLGRYRVYEAQTQEGYLDGNWEQYFTLTNDTNGHTITYEVTNTPTRYRFIKTDDEGKGLAGCVFVLVDASGNEVDSWTTDATGIHEITAKLREGETYTLREIDCPIGYEKAADHQFTVSSSKDWVEITTVNKKICGSVTINKFDAGGNRLSGAEYALMTTQVISGAETCQYNGKTYYVLEKGKTEDGMLTFSGINTTERYEYIVVESSSPAGISLLKDPIDLGVLPIAATNVVKADYTGKRQTRNGVTYLYDLSYDVVNTANITLPLTGETNTLFAVIPFLFVVMAVMIAAIIHKNGRKEK